MKTSGRRAHGEPSSSAQEEADGQYHKGSSEHDEGVDAAATEAAMMELMRSMHGKGELDAYGQGRGINAFRRYEPEQEDWAEYVEQMNQYMEANGVIEYGTKKANMLAWVGAETYKLIKKLMAAQGITKFANKDIIRLVDEY
ncbi:hypothetical protein ACOME3_008570 [Neoechinorhynchus agilis]